MDITKQIHNHSTWFTLTNDHDVSIIISDFGATVIAINTPDKDGNVANIILGFMHSHYYAQHHDYFGATVARVAGRLGGASWNGHQLDQNSGTNHIHGGDHPSISYSHWNLIKLIKTDGQIGAVLQYISPAGQNGYPGRLSISAMFVLDQNNKFTITYFGNTSAPTLFNPTTHIYFNLSGNAQRLINDSDLQVNADEIAETDAANVPTGTLLSVAETPFDFRQKTNLGDALSKLPNGLDTPFKLNTQTDSKPQLRLQDPLSGRKLAIHTNSNSLILFSTTGFEGDFLVDGTRTMTSQLGLAIEPQMLPDAPNHPGFGNIVITPDSPMIYQNSYTFN
ncbi:aldose epimerase family protein [Pediococcus ethanolidurans]|uniref:aldose epimerase family protein n=1 Tax=Pediococcus ethanolidurans TaxID=319653 RepID=UPI001C1EC4AA|nr:aldose epimerase family protein [Pediococcus ethanolidurans]MBU7554609.1 galactose mutarotase [Pediococcus ethanolidurans]MBU7563357.1 galactose mutarotase [Pediococcus ethanolidurans]MCV3315269.1 galactose mutarotase [Pediococcus ethanolidurans]MCV3327529.1 galactose mutarotase [Pediococcus ethanolidurans]